MNKECTSCHEIKDLEEFDKHKGGKYGKRSICKQCQALSSKEYRKNNKAFIKDLKNKYRNSFEGFVMYSLGQARHRNKYEFSIDYQFLTDLWNKQNGLCTFTGLPLEYSKVPGIKNPYQGSLDRIDSSKGYTKDNVRWVCWFINQMKSDYSENEFKDLIRHAAKAL